MTFKELDKRCEDWAKSGGRWLTLKFFFRWIDEHKVLMSIWVASLIIGIGLCIKFDDGTRLGDCKVLMTCLIIIGVYFIMLIIMLRHAVKMIPIILILCLAIPSRAAERAVCNVEQFLNPLIFDIPIELPMEGPSPILHADGWGLYIIGGILVVAGAAGIIYFIIRACQIPPRVLPDDDEEGTNIVSYSEGAYYITTSVTESCYNVGSTNGSLIAASQRSYQTAELNITLSSNLIPALAVSRYTPSTNLISIAGLNFNPAHPGVGYSKNGVPIPEHESRIQFARNESGQIVPLIRKAGMNGNIYSVTIEQSEDLVIWSKLTQIYTEVDTHIKILDTYDAPNMFYRIVTN